MAQPSIKDRFPILLPTDDRQVEDAIFFLELAHADQVLSKAQYTKAVRNINARMRKAWDSVADTYLGTLERYAPTKGIQELYYAIPHSLQEVRSFGKKMESGSFDALKGTPAFSQFKVFIETSTAYYRQMLPLVEKVEYLRDVVKSGKNHKAAPTSESVSDDSRSSFVAKSASPDQIRKTCPFCFRRYAVVNGVIARHGFRLSRTDYKGDHVGACFGSQLVPYEDSRKGVEAGIRMVEKALLNVAGYLGNYDNWKEVSFRNRGPVRKGDSGWEEIWYLKKRECEKEIGVLSKKLAMLNEKAKEWKKVK